MVSYYVNRTQSTHGVREQNDILIKCYDKHRYILFILGRYVSFIMLFMKIVLLNVYRYRDGEYINILQYVYTDDVVK